MSTSSSYLVSLFFLVLAVTCFQQVHKQHDLMSYYQNHSLKPILHTYYNRHFKNSTKFKQYQKTLQQLYNHHKDYIDILLTDCDQDKQLKLQSCALMSRTKDNRYIVGTVPSSKFRKMNNIYIQSPPLSQALGEHLKDTYSEQQLMNLMRNLLPNYYQQLTTKEQYEQFLQPRYSPKMIVFLKDDDQMPIVLKETAIANFLKMDFAFISDLNEELIKLFKVKEYPSFVVMKYNFNESKHQYHYFPESQFLQEDYTPIKKFVTKFTLQTPRNDLLFHKIQKETHSDIITIETAGELEEQKEKTNGWLIISHSDGQVPQNLRSLHERYGRYFTYVNYVHEHDGNNLQLYNPGEKMSFPMKHEELRFNSLNFQEFKSNMTLWLAKDMIILGAQQKYGHICGIAETYLFRGHVRCIIISDQGLQELKQFMKIDFDVGFLVRSQKSKSKDGARQTKGLKFSDDNYDSIYYEIDYQTRLKIKDQLDEYLQKPVSEVPEQMSISTICSHPFKKCLFLIANLNKNDRTFQTYLKEITFDFMSSFSIYEMDINSNPEFIKAIGGIKDKKADILAYNPRTRQYTRLNKKVTKNLISEFIKAYLREDKRLKYEDGAKLDMIAIHRKDGIRQINQMKKANKEVQRTEQIQTIEQKQKEEQVPEQL